MKVFSSREAPADLVMIVGLLLFVVGGIFMRPLLQPRPERLPDGSIKRDTAGQTVYDSASAAQVRETMRPHDLSVFAGLSLAGLGVIWRVMIASAKRKQKAPETQ